MRILHVAKKYPNAVGGDAVVVANLQKQQEAAGHHVAILTSNCKEIISGESIYTFGLRDTPAALDHISIRRLISLCMLFFKAFIVVARERPAVIHSHSVDMAFFVSFAARLYRIPIVHTFHIVTFNNADQSALRRKSELRLAKMTKPHKVTAPNEFDVRALQQAGLSQAELLPNGVDMDFWSTGTSGSNSKAFTFVSVGRLESQKGYEYLIDAAQLLAATRQDFKIVLVGDGTSHDALLARAKEADVDHLFAFVGRKSPPEVHELLSGADAAIFPSLYETTPITLLESWAMRLPVVATPVGILQGESQSSPVVFLAQVKDADSLYQAMLACMNDQQARAKKVANGYAEAQKYTWTNIATTAEGLYGAVL